MKCYVCGDEAINRLGRSNLCAKHRRFIQMQKTAKQDKKYVPSIYEIENITPLDMICQDCGVLMNWIDGSNRPSNAVLQHYRDGSIGVTCMSCNTKHGMMPGDSYRDLPDGHKLCTGCKTIKPLTSFASRKDGKRPYPMSKCRQCNLAANKEWRKSNPEKYKETTKRNNQIKRENPELARERDKRYYWAKKERKLNGNIAIRSDKNSVEAGQRGNGSDPQNTP
jgi:hypothetical protein